MFLLLSFSVSLEPGRVKLYGSQFARKGDEGLIYFQLEKKSVFSWIRGEIGLRIYYFDDLEVGSDQDMNNDNAQQPPPSEKEGPPQPQQEGRKLEDVRMEAPAPTEVVTENLHQPPMVTVEEAPPAVTVQMENHHNQQHHGIHSPPFHPEYPPEIRRMQTGRVGVGIGGGDRVRVLKRPDNGDYSPRVISRRSANGEPERIPAYDLVEPMQYLFVRIVKARGLSQHESPYVRIGSSVRSKPGIPRPGEER
ncbi:hypothetical protein LXL04_037479 [Taraxacum kok-saghyz]